MNTPEKNEIKGLLSKSINAWPGDEPGIGYCDYKVVGIFKRNLVYFTSSFEAGEEGNVEIHYEENIELNRYTDKWLRRDFFKILGFELKYQIEGFIKHREYLDLIAPYFISGASLLTFVFKDSFIA